jgi:chorismate mutase/prephenate dehydratase
MRDINDTRAEIDSIDDQIIELFKRRMDCAKDVAEYKYENNIPILNVQREEEILSSVQKRGGNYYLYSRMLFEEILSLSRALQEEYIRRKKSGNDL